MNRNLYPFMSLALLIFSIAPIQETAAQAVAKPSRGESLLEEVVVTARRIEESMQDVPISISAFTGETLERRQIVSADQLSQISPNLQFSPYPTTSGNNSAAQVFIRGIGQSDPSATVDPGVGIYVDDVYMGQSAGGVIDFLDIERVEVLRGPQGTLFGRNTIGGAVLLTTKDPGDVFGGTFRFGVGDYDLREASLAVDVPVSETFKTRFTFGTRIRDGYVIRLTDGTDLGNDDGYSLTGKAVWTPTDKFTLKIKLDYTEEDENGVPQVFAAYNESAVFGRVASAQAFCPGFTDRTGDGIPDFFSLPAVPLIDDSRCMNDFQGAGPKHSKGTFPLESTLENWGVAVTAQYAVRDYLTLKSIIAYRSLEWTGKRDADNTPFTILHTDIDSDGEYFTTELQGLFRFDNIYGVVGLYYGDENSDERFVVDQVTPPAGTRATASNVDVKNTNWAIFSQWTYDVNKALSLTGGFRYTEETKGAVPDLFDLRFPDVKFTPVRLLEEDFESLTGSASVAYRWNESVMTYFSWSQGFKGGGFVSRISDEGLASIGATEPPRFDEETAETFEIGFKSDFFNRSLRLNGSFFTTDYDDLQFAVRIGTAPVIFNAGKASIDGFELEFAWAPHGNLIVEGGVGYLDASIDELADIIGTITTITTDNTLAYTPDWSANIGVAYTQNLFGSISATPRIDAIYQDSFFVDTVNTVEIAQTSSYTLLNASVVFDSDQGAWSLMAGVNNLTDKRYVVAGNSSLTTGAGYAEVAYGRTREWFVRLSYAF